MGDLLDLHARNNRLWAKERVRFFGMETPTVPRYGYAGRAVAGLNIGSHKSYKQPNKKKDILQNVDAQQRRVKIKHVEDSLDRKFGVKLWKRRSYTFSRSLISSGDATISKKSLKRKRILKECPYVCPDCAYQERKARTVK